MSVRSYLWPLQPPSGRLLADFRLQRSQRQRASLWSRDYYPTGLLHLQGVWSSSVGIDNSVLAQNFWCYQAAAKFLFFEELRVVLLCKAGTLVHQGALAASKASAGEASSITPDSEPPDAESRELDEQQVQEQSFCVASFRRMSTTNSAKRLRTV